MYTYISLYAYICAKYDHNYDYIHIYVYIYIYIYSRVSVD